jgi:hypothetical protein
VGWGRRKGALGHKGRVRHMRDLGELLLEGLGSGGRDSRESNLVDAAVGFGHEVSDA